MHNIEIFYHMFCVKNCIELFLNTYDKICKSNLIDYCNINVSLVGNGNLMFYQSQIEHLPKVKFKYYTTNINGEMNTIENIHNFCNNHLTKKTNILYLHSKGVTHNLHKPVESWRNYMEYFVITKWKDCIEALTFFDTCGVNLQNEPAPHYSGNFWWATSDYIKSLPQFNIDNCNVCYCKNNPRSYCEFWLLDNNFHQSTSLHNSNVNHYHAIYDESKYKQLI